MSITFVTLIPLLMYDKFNIGLSGAAILPIISSSVLYSLGLMETTPIVAKMDVTKWATASIIAVGLSSAAAVNSTEYIYCMAFLESGGHSLLSSA